MNNTKANCLLVVLVSTLGFTAFSQEKSLCRTPTPFIKLDPVAAKKVQLTDILAATESAKTSEPAKDNKKLTANTLNDDELHKGEDSSRLVNFWAAWCSPCRQELPFINSLSEKKLAKVSIINVGDEKKAAKKILNELAIKHVNQYYADGEILSNFNILGLPASIVYSKKQVFLGVGKLSDEKSISQWLKCLNDEGKTDNN